MATETYVTREDITNLLSDEEIARIAAAQARWLSEGEDYVDLDHPEDGVHKVNSDAPPRPGHVVPRGLVGERAWSAILARLGRSSAPSLR